MNFVREILSFERWLEVNHLPIASIRMWYKFFFLFNRCGWMEWVSVDNQRLMGFIQTKREATAIQHRDNLINAGLLEYKKGKKGTPNKYKLISLENTFNNVVQSEVESVVFPVVQSEVESVVHTADINKQNKTKQNKTNSIINDVRNGDAYLRIEKAWNTGHMLPIHFAGMVADTLLRYLNDGFCVEVIEYAIQYSISQGTCTLTAVRNRILLLKLKGVISKEQFAKYMQQEEGAGEF